MDEARGPIWIVDSKQWPRACLRAELMERGFDVIGFPNPVQAIAAFHLRIYVAPRLIVLDLFELEGTDEDIDVLSKLGIPIMILGGAAQLNKEIVRKGTWAAVMRRPYTIGNVAEKVEQFLK